MHRNLFENKQESFNFFIYLNNHYKNLKLTKKEENKILLNFLEFFVKRSINGKLIKNSIKNCALYEPWAFFRLVQKDYTRKATQGFT